MLLSLSTLTFFFATLFLSRLLKIHEKITNTSFARRQTRKKKKRKMYSTLLPSLDSDPLPMFHRVFLLFILQQNLANLPEIRKKLTKSKFRCDSLQTIVRLLRLFKKFILLTETASCNDAITSSVMLVRRSKNERDNS